MIHLALLVAATAQLPPNGEQLQRVLQGDPESDFAQCAPVDGEARRRAEAENQPIVDLALGRNMDPVLSGNPAYFPLFRNDDSLPTSNAKMRISLELGGEKLSRSIGGMSNVVIALGISPGRRRLHSVDFYDQMCALTLGDALGRARELERILAGAGFAKPRQLVVSDEYGSLRSRKIGNWNKASRLLADAPATARLVTATWRREQQQASVSVWNWGAKAPRTELEIEVTNRLGPLSVFEADGTGRKYGIELSLRDNKIFEDDLEAYSGVESQGTVP